MTPPAILAGGSLPRAAKIGLAVMAAGELAADKQPQMPARTQALPFAGRMLIGAITAGALASPSRRVEMSVAGAIGALCGTLLMYHARRAATERGVPNIVAGLIEDTITVSASSALRRRVSAG
jgi:uncharacterized membrane protein